MFRHLFLRELNELIVNLNSIIRQWLLFSLHSFIAKVFSLFLSEKSLKRIQKKNFLLTFKSFVCLQKTHPKEHTINKEDLKVKAIAFLCICVKSIRANKVLHFVCEAGPLLSAHVHRLALTSESVRAPEALTIRPQTTLMFLKPRDQ